MSEINNLIAAGPSAAEHEQLPEGAIGEWRNRGRSAMFSIRLTPERTGRAGPLCSIAANLSTSPRIVSGNERRVAQHSGMSSRSSGQLDSWPLPGCLDLGRHRWHSASTAVSCTIHSENVSY
jgi:hypothetical protein